MKLTVFFLQKINKIGKTLTRLLIKRKAQYIKSKTKETL